MDKIIEKLYISNYNNIVGFIGPFKNQINVYKVKQINKKRNKGARCDQSGKTEAINLLNNIIGENKYNIENSKKYNQLFICIIQELYLRYYNSINKDNKVWFIKPEIAIINNIEKLQI